MVVEELSWDVFNVEEDPPLSGVSPDGDGRCSARSLFASGRHQAWASRRFAAVHEGDLVPFSSWRDLAALESKGFAGQVVSAPLTGEFDLSSAEFMDSSTVRGGFPLDCPVSVRERLGLFGSRLAQAYGSSSGLRELKASLALRLRSLGYPDLDDDALLSLASGMFPSLVEVSSRHLQGATLHRSSPFPLMARLLPASERSFAAGFLPPDRRERFLALSGKYPTLVGWGPDGSPAYLQVLRPTGEDTASVVMSLAASWPQEPSMVSRERIVKAWWEEKSAVEGFCFVCHESPCSCSPGERLKFEVLAHSGKSRSVFSTKDHAWGHSGSVKATFRMHSRAVERAPRVTEVLSGLSSAAGVDLSSLGPSLGYNVSLFLEQTGRDESFLLEVGVSLLQELSGADRRAREVHGFYARTLFREFEDPSTRTVSSPRTEVFLGRDGVYAYQARLEQQRVLRQGLSASQRAQRRREANDARFVTMSRAAFWSKEKDSLLGDPSKPPLFVDTGFAGTIPERIMVSRGEMPAREQGVGGVKPEGRVRLFSTPVSEYAFSSTVSKDDALAVERDAKPVRSSTMVNGGHPTSALEQLVFRQLVDSVRRFAREETLRVADV